MDWWKIAELTLQSATLLVVAGGLLYAGRQVSLLKLSHVQDHEWRRRKASQDAVFAIRDKVPNLNLLNEHLRYIALSEPVPLEVVKNKFSEVAELQGALHSLLNFLELLAIGVQNGVYDEKIVRASYRGMMITTWEEFSAYIRDRRKASPRVWVEFEALATKWKHEDSKPAHRDRTGHVEHRSTQ